MKAAILKNKRHIEIQDIDIPSIKTNEVLLRVHYAGICSTDIKIFHGELPCKYPVILGHEFCGEAVEIGSEAKNIIRGDCYNVQPNLSCGYCIECRKDKYSLCKNKICYGTHVNGSLSEYCAIDYRLLYPISEDKTFEGTFIEPIACCLYALNRCSINIGDNVLIIGGGFTGLIFIQLVKLRGGKVCLVTRSDHKRALARSLGADLTCKSIPETDMDFDVVIDAVGKPETIDSSIRAAARGGKLLLFGVNPTEVTVPINPYTVWEKELVIVASRGNGHNHFGAIRTMSKVNITSLVSHVIDLEAFETISGIIEDENHIKTVVSFV